MPKQEIVLVQKSSSYKIQREVRELLSCKSLEEWGLYLQNAGKRHLFYYHYTTLSTLKAILSSSHWRMKQASKSNDFHECKIHNASFTTGVLSSMGMWNQYSSLKGKNDIGVRIGIPKETFDQIFSQGNIWKKISNGSWEKIESDYSVVTTDIAYWYFGSADDGTYDRLFYKGYVFPFLALGIYEKDTLKRFAQNSIKGKTFDRPDPKKKLPPCFKHAVWRSEAETRVYCDFRPKNEDGNIVEDEIPGNIPDEVYAEITPEQFGKMKFRLSPKNFSEVMLTVPENRKQLIDLFLFFGIEGLLGTRIRLEQFHLPSEQEAWVENN